MDERAGVHQLGSVQTPISACVRQDAVDQCLHAVNASLEQAHVFPRLCTELLPEIVLHPLRQVGDATQWRPEVVRGPLGSLPRRHGLQDRA